MPVVSVVRGSVSPAQALFLFTVVRGYDDRRCPFQQNASFSMFQPDRTIGEMVALLLPYGADFSFCDNTLAIEDDLGETHHNTSQTLRSEYRKDKYPPLPPIYNKKTRYWQSKLSRQPKNQRNIIRFLFHFFRNSPFGESPAECGYAAINRLANNSLAKPANTCERSVFFIKPR